MLLLWFLFRARLPPLSLRISVRMNITNRSRTLALEHYSIFPKSLSSLFSIHKSLPLLPGIFPASLRPHLNVSNLHMIAELFKWYAKNLIYCALFKLVRSLSAASFASSKERRFILEKKTEKKKRGGRNLCSAIALLSSLTPCLFNLRVYTSFLPFLWFLTFLPPPPIIIITCLVFHCKVKWASLWMSSPRSHRRSCSEATETGCRGRLMLCRDFVPLRWRWHRTCSPRQLRIRHAKWQFLAHVIGSAETWFPGGILRSAFKLISTNFYEPCQAVFFGVFFFKCWISVIWLVLVVVFRLGRLWNVPLCLQESLRWSVGHFVH